MPHRSLFASALAAALLIGLPLGFQHAVAQEPAPVEEPAPETPPTETVVAAEVSEETAPAPSDAAQAGIAEAAPDAEGTAPAEAPQAVEETPQKVEPEMVQTSGDQKLRFNFASTSWKDVLLWLSEEANLSLKADRYPEGTLSFVDPSREYSVSEALDQLNRQLLDRGFAMVRRGRLLMLIDLESPLAGKYMENIAELVVPEALDQRGDSDIVKCIFPLGAMTPEAADEELRQMLGPSMPMTILGSARQVVITDTVARLKAIRKVLDDATNAGLEVTEITLQHRAADEILVLARPLLGLPEDSNSTDSIRIAIDPFGDRMFVTGEPSAVALLERIVEKADKPLVVEGGETQAVALPELRTYPIAVADPPTVFDVMSTLLAGLPDTRLSLDPASNSLVVFARPETHTIVQSALDKLEGKGVQVDTIQLRRLEPSAALLTINKFFGKTEENNAGPIVDGDPITGRLWIRGTAEQIQLTKDLIDRLEGNDSMGNLTDRIRVLPYSGQNATELLEQAEMMWGVSGRKNRIRMISPSSGKSTSGFPERRLRRDESEEEEAGIDTNEEAAAETPQTAGRAMINNPFRLAVQRDANEAPADSAGETAPQTPAEKQPAEDKTGSDIVITMTPQGMIVASEDPAALTEFEDLMRTLSEQTTYSNQPPTVFWLKFVKASVASGMVTSILGGDSGGGSMGGDAGLLGELGGGLGMLGGLMGLGGGGGDTGGGGGPILTATGSVSIVPDDRLNALFVQANGVDMQMIETILEVIDREESPEDVQTVARPRLIPVIYSQASEVATIIKSVFTDRIAGDTSRGGNNNQPKPEDIIAALRGGGGRGGRGGGGGGAQAEKSEPAKISIGIDERSNTLIVTATPQDFEEVRLLVEQIDQAGAESEETTSVIALNGSVNPQVVQQALESVLGRPVASTNSTSTTSSNSSNNNASSSNNGPSTSDIQRRIEAFRAMQGGGGFGGRPSGAAGGRPGGSGGPTSGGGRSGGGRPGGGRGGR